MHCQLEQKLKTVHRTMVSEKRCHGLFYTLFNVQMDY